MTKDTLYCNYLFIQILIIIFLSTASYFNVETQSLDIKDVNFLIFGINSDRIANFTMLVCIFLNTTHSGNIKKIKDGTLLLLIISVIAFYIFSTLISYSGIKDLNAITGFIIVFLYFHSLISLINIKKRLEFIFKSLFYIGIISAIFSLYLPYTENFFGFYQPSTYYRLVGWYGNPNILATVLSLAVIISYFYWYPQKKLVFVLSTFFWLHHYY